MLPLVCRKNGHVYKEEVRAIRNEIYNWMLRYWRGRELYWIFVLFLATSFALFTTFLGAELVAMADRFNSMLRNVCGRFYVIFVNNVVDLLGVRHLECLLLKPAKYM